MQEARRGPKSGLRHSTDFSLSQQSPPSAELSASLRITRRMPSPCAKQVQACKDNSTGLPSRNNQPLRALKFRIISSFLILLGLGTVAFKQTAEPLVALEPSTRWLCSRAHLGLLSLLCVWPPCSALIEHLGKWLLAPW